MSGTHDNVSNRATRNENANENEDEIGGNLDGRAATHFGVIIGRIAPAGGRVQRED